MAGKDIMSTPIHDSTSSNNDLDTDETGPRHQPEMWPQKTLRNLDDVELDDMFNNTQTPENLSVPKSEISNTDSKLKGKAWQAFHVWSCLCQM